MKMNISKEIPNSEDWRTDTEDPMINAFRELMAYNNQFQDDPNVGRIKTFKRRSINETT